MKPILVDLFCCQGGASRGFWRSGFVVIGVDKDHQPRFPTGDGMTFHRADAIETLADLIEGKKLAGLFGLDEISGFAASPPCQGYSDCQRIRGRDHPKLIEATRLLLQETGKPYVIENVPGAKDDLVDPFMLCGTMFPELRIYRHRYFEANFAVDVPDHPEHVAPPK